MKNYSIAKEAKRNKQFTKENTQVFINTKKEGQLYY
jgi:hypothetical protein